MAHLLRSVSALQIPTQKKLHRRFTTIGMCVSIFSSCPSFEALLSLKKTSTIQPHRGVRSLFCVSSHKKRYPSKFRNFLCFLVSHRRNMSGKRIFVVTERCIFLGQKKGTTSSSRARRTPTGPPPCRLAHLGARQVLFVRAGGVRVHQEVRQVQVARAEAEGRHSSKQLENCPG